MRQATQAQIEVLRSAHYVTHTRIRVRDADGVWRDLSHRFAGAEWSEDIDQPIVQPRIRLERDGHDGSLSPLVETSPYNRRADEEYDPLLEAGRRIQILTACTLPHVAPGPSDWDLMFDGSIDEVEWDHTPLALYCRDPGGELQDRQIEDPETYGTEEGVPLEEVMQQVLDDTLGTPGSPSPVVLHVPVSPGFMVTAYEPDPGPLMDAMLSCAGAIGWDVRYLWHEASGSFRLTLIEPDRESETPVHTFGPTEYIDVARLQIGREGIRNRVQVTYHDEITREVQRVTVNDIPSQDRYGIRFMRLAEDEHSPIRTGSAALRMASAGLADLAEPKAEQEIELRYWPLAELGDLYRFVANGDHYTTDQEWAVVGVRHTLTPSSQRTVISARGRPAASYGGWHQRSQRPPETSTELYAQCHVGQVATHSETVEIEVRAEPGYGRVWLDSLESATVISGPVLDGDGRASSPARWTIERPEPDQGQGLAVFGAEAPGYVPDFTPLVIAQQGRDTVALIMRATVRHQTDTTLTVRVAVADPLAGKGLTEPIRIVAVGQGGTGIDWPGRGPLDLWAEIPVASLTDDIDTTGYIDYDLTRAEAGTGSVTWTASALDDGTPPKHVRVQATDTQVVPELVAVKALRPICTVEIISYESETAAIRLRGRDWQGSTEGLEYRYRTYQRDPGPMPWPTTWIPLVDGEEDGLSAPIHPRRNTIFEAQVRDATGLESLPDEVTVEPRLDALDEDGLVDEEVPTSGGYLIETDAIAIVRAEATLTAAGRYTDELAGVLPPSAVVIYSGDEPDTRPGDGDEEGDPLERGDIWINDEGDPPLDYVWTGTAWRRRHTIIHGGSILTGTVEGDVLIAGTEVISPVVRDPQGRLVIDARPGRPDTPAITIRDAQSPPVERVRLGKLGAGADAYGLDIRDRHGRLILDETGRVGSVVDVPKQLRIVEVMNNETLTYEDLGVEEILGTPQISYLSGGVWYEGRARWSDELDDTRANDGTGSGTTAFPSPPLPPVAIAPEFSGDHSPELRLIRFNAYLRTVVDPVEKSEVFTGSGVTTVGGVTQPCVVGSQGEGALGYRFTIEYEIEVEATADGPFFTIEIEGRPEGEGPNDWVSLDTHPARWPSSGLSRTYSRTVVYQSDAPEFRIRVVGLENDVPDDDWEVSGVSVTWYAEEGVLYASATPSKAEKARFMVVLEQ